MWKCLWRFTEAIFQTGSRKISPLQASSRKPHSGGQAANMHPLHPHCHVMRKYHSFNRAFVCILNTTRVDLYLFFNAKPGKTTRQCDEKWASQLHQETTKNSSFEISICSCTSSSVKSAGIGLNSFWLIRPKSMASLSISRNSRWAAANLGNSWEARNPRQQFEIWLLIYYGGSKYALLNS